MKHASLLGLVGVCAALVSPVGTAAVIYDVAADWSTTDNPNGPWSYLHGTALLPNQPTACCGLPAAPSFAPSHVPGTFLPVFGQATSGADIYVHSYDPFNGGAAQGEAVLAWTAPMSGLADVSGYFYYSQITDQRSNDVSIRLGSSVLGSAVLSYLDHQDEANRWSFSFNNLAVNTGDMLTVIFQRSAGQSAGSSNVGNLTVTLTAAAVPAPPTGALIFAGMAALIGSLVRRRAA